MVWFQALENTVKAFTTGTLHTRGLPILSLPIIQNYLGPLAFSQTLHAPSAIESYQGMTSVPHRLCGSFCSPFSALLVLGRISTKFQHAT